LQLSVFAVAAARGRAAARRVECAFVCPSPHPRAMAWHGMGNVKWVARTYVGRGDASESEAGKTDTEHNRLTGDGEQY
jgi:hypothetical protein